MVAFHALTHISLLHSTAVFIRIHFFISFQTCSHLVPFLLFVSFRLFYNMQGSKPVSFSSASFLSSFKGRTVPCYFSFLLLASPSVYNLHYSLSSFSFSVVYMAGANLLSWRLYFWASVRNTNHLIENNFYDRRITLKKCILSHLSRPETRAQFPNVQYLEILDSVWRQSSECLHMP